MEAEDHTRIQWFGEGAGPQKSKREDGQWKRRITAIAAD